jgi:argininosuccinate lyase
MSSQAAADFITVTELADTLVRQAAMSFREAHALVGKAVRTAGSDHRPRAIATALLAQNPSLPMTEDQIAQALEPENFIQVRRITGGPAPHVVSEALQRARSEQAVIEEWIRSKQKMLDDARRVNIGA